MNPPATENPDWPLTIGLFVINFGVLDLLVFDFLKDRLPPERFAEIQKLHFQDRVAQIKEQVAVIDWPWEKWERFEKFVRRLEPVRKLRNQVAHGLLLARPVEGTKNFVVTLAVPRDLDTAGAPESQPLDFDTLVGAVNELTALIEEFKELTDWGRNV